MEKQGLLEKPRFNNPEYYLGEGTLTKQTQLLKDKVSKIINDGDDDRTKVQKLLIWLSNDYLNEQELYNRNNKKEKSSPDLKKFNKTAEYILENYDRRGCSDAATLCSTMFRIAGIPTMQVITFDKDWAKEVLSGRKMRDKNGLPLTMGHFYVAGYFDNGNGKDWFLINPTSIYRKPKDFYFQVLSREDRNITLSKDRYAFAYCIDCRDFELDGLKIDSIRTMEYIQTQSCLKSNRKDLHIEFDKHIEDDGEER